MDRDTYERRTVDALVHMVIFQVPSEEMGRCVLRAWCQCVGYGGRARESVLQSVYRLLDRCRENLILLYVRVVRTVHGG